MLIPKILTLLVTAAGLFVVALLSFAAWSRRGVKSEAGNNHPVSRREVTNRWLRRLTAACAVALLLLVSIHAYWAFWSDSNPNFNRARAVDLRNRRISESALKGWVFDRSGSLDRALIRYRSEAGVISREYPLGPAAVHVTGYSDFIFGSGGIEYAYRKWLTQPASTYNTLISPSPVGQDLTVSVDAIFQRELFSLLERTGKPCGAVVLLLPKNEILAMASTPSFDPVTISDERAWVEITARAEKSPERSPLVNRALGTLVTGGRAYYYRPGSTFKVFTAAVALDAGVTQERFTCSANGFTAPGASRPIRDFDGEVHGDIVFEDAFRLSCNQYFAQLGLKLGRDRLSNYARRLGFAISPNDDTLRQTAFWRVSLPDEGDFNSMFAPPIARMNLSSRVTGYDIALQSFGQGYDDATVIQMAALAACVGSGGSLVQPTFELSSDTADEKTPGDRLIRPEAAARLREMMQSVVQSGTAAGAFSSLKGRITAGGKTGTADRDVVAYGRDGNPIVDRIGSDGKPRYRFEGWTDSWFIGFAPADNPRIAFAVVVENGGPGSQSAAPIAVKLIEKANGLGYLKKSPAINNRVPAID